MEICSASSAERLRSARVVASNDACLAALASSCACELSVFWPVSPTMPTTRITALMNPSSAKNLCEILRLGRDFIRLVLSCRHPACGGLGAPVGRAVGWVFGPYLLSLS